MNLEGSLISPFSNYFTHQIEEFFIFGIKTHEHAQKLFTDAFYRGEVLFSVPNQWAYFTDTKETLNAFRFKIPEENPGTQYFSCSINEMQINCSYLHCLVVYQDLSELINSAKTTINYDLLKSYEPRAENKECYILNPIEIKKTQKKYYYPFNLVIKTRSQHHNFYRKFLEEMMKILEKNPFDNKNMAEIFKKEEELHFFRLVKFSANLFFMLNNLIKPTTSTKISYKLDKVILEFEEQTVLIHPFSEDPILLSILELEVEAAVFLWKSLIIGSNVIVIAEDNQKRFTIMEALSFLMFPLSPPNKISSFVLRVDIEATKLILSASHYFIGYSSRFITMEKLLVDDYIVENYSLCDLDHSTCYPQNKPTLDLGEWETDLKEKLTNEKQLYLQKLRKMRNHENFNQELVTIQKETSRAISKYFFEFFENEAIFNQIEGFLNLKKVEILSDHKSILKQPWKLIELFKKPKEFIKSMIEEYSFNNFARELISIDLNPSYRFKNIISAISFEKKNKDKPVFPCLHQRFEIKSEELLYFVRKVITMGGIWEENKYEAFQQLLDRESKAQEITFNSIDTVTSIVKTPLVDRLKPNLIDFLMGLSSDFIFSESEDLQSKTVEVVKSLNFNEIIRKDIGIIDKNIESNQNTRGQLFNLIDYHDNQKHLFTINKALYYFTFYNDNNEKDNNTSEIFEMFLNSYREYLQFEVKSKMNKECVLHPNFDFPDFPRTDFSKFLSKKAKDFLPDDYLVKFKELNPNSNIVSLIIKRMGVLKSKLMMSSDTIANFPTICYNYLNFLKNFFRRNNALTTLINVTNHNKSEIRLLFQKLANEEKYNIKQIDEVFAHMENEMSVHLKNYSDEEKLSFYLNFFNLKLLHEILFNRLTNENKAFPKNSKEWMEFLSSIKFRLFGVNLDLWEFDSTIIRQHLNINHLFIPVTSFFTKFTGLNEGELFNRKKNNIGEEFEFFIRKLPLKMESLLHFAQFYCIRDTPIYIIFDDPKSIEDSLVEHTKENFKFFKKINNFNYLKNPRSLQIPIPVEFLQSQDEDVSPMNETIRSFLIKYYDNRIDEFKINQITFKEVSIQWNMFYLNPSYFA